MVDMVDMYEVRNPPCPRDVIDRLIKSAVNDLRDNPDWNESWRVAGDTVILVIRESFERSAIDGLGKGFEDVLTVYESRLVKNGYART